VKLLHTPNAGNPSDPDELQNLIGQPEHAGRLGRLRAALAAELRRTAASGAMLRRGREPQEKPRFAGRKREPL
jgi:hypothetical protein